MLRTRIKKGKDFDKLSARITGNMPEFPTETKVPTNRQKYYIAFLQI